MNPFKADNSGYQINNRREADNRFFKNTKPMIHPEKETKKEFIEQQNDFPTLEFHNEMSGSSCSTLKPAISFVDMMKECMNAENNPSILEEIVDPGWVSIKQNNETSQIEWKWGAKTKYMKQLDRKEQLKDNLSYCMHKTVIKLHHQYIRYEELYDEIYGEGSYDHLYRYGTSYDSATDDETDNDEKPYDSHIDNEDDYY